MILPLLMLLTSWTLQAQTCRYKAPTYFMPVEKSFCLNFATDYLYRLMEMEETHTYRYGRNTQSVARGKLSRDGAIFMLGQARAEAGWGGKAFRANNFWGLGGDYKQADGSSSFMEFKSFDESFAYLLAHFDRGISRKGYDSPQHPGWPAFMPLLQQPGALDLRAINQSLNSGQWCKRYPAYNTDQQAHCRGQKSCPCLDYARLIMDLSSKLAISRCLAVYATYKDSDVVKSAVFQSGGGTAAPVPFRERLDLAHRALKNYAMEHYPDLYCQKDSAPLDTPAQEFPEFEDAREQQCGKPAVF